MYTFNPGKSCISYTHMPVAGYGTGPRGSNYTAQIEMSNCDYYIVSNCPDSVLIRYSLIVVDSSIS